MTIQDSLRTCPTDFLTSIRSFLKAMPAGKQSKPKGRTKLPEIDLDELEKCKPVGKKEYKIIKELDELRVKWR